MNFYYVRYWPDSAGRKFDLSRKHPRTPARSCSPAMRLEGGTRNSINNSGTEDASKCHSYKFGRTGVEFNPLRPTVPSEMTQIAFRSYLNLANSSWTLPLLIINLTINDL